MNNWIELGEERDHKHAIEKLNKVVEVAQAFASSNETHDIEIDVHIDRYGDTKIKISANKKQ